MHPKEAGAMANSVDPDQTASSEAVWSWSALFAETYLSQYIEFLRYLLLSYAKVRANLYNRRLKSYFTFLNIYIGILMYLVLVQSTFLTVSSATCSG